MSRWSSNQPLRYLVTAIIGLLLPMLPMLPAAAASLSAKDVLIIGKVLGFLDPPYAGGVIAVLYAPGNPASLSDAADIAALFDAGPRGNAIAAEPVAASALGQGKRYVAVILAAGVSAASVLPAIRASHLLCITSDVAEVEAGNCVLAIRSGPRVDIVLNHDLAASVGIGFATAFRMLVHEI